MEGIMKINDILPHIRKYERYLSISHVIVTIGFVLIAVAMHWHESEWFHFFSKLLSFIVGISILFSAYLDFYSIQLKKKSIDTQSKVSVKKLITALIIGVIISSISMYIINILINVVINRASVFGDYITSTLCILSSVYFIVLMIVCLIGEYKNRDD